MTHNEPYVTSGCVVSRTGYNIPQEGSSALFSEPFVLFVSFVVKQSGVQTLLPAVIAKNQNEKMLLTRDSKKPFTGGEPL
jgi:hypothetical protein